MGAYDHNIYALHAGTGKVAWTFETDAQIHATPCIAGNLVAIAGCDGNLRLLDWSTGTESFRFQTGSNMGACPAWDGKQFYLATLDGRLMALNPSRKDPVVWQTSDAAEPEPFVAGAAVRGKHVVFAGRDKIIRCLDSIAGSEIWRFSAKARVDSSPVIAGNWVLTGGDDGFLRVLSLNKGKEIWQFQTGAPIRGTPAVAADRIVVAAEDGGVYCFEVMRETE